MTSKDYRIEPSPKDHGSKPLFRIVYTIDVNGDSPQKAAEYAYELMADPESMRPVLDVIDSKGYVVRIDLSEDIYCAAAEYIAEQGRKIFTGYMNGGLWNARCMDASIESKKQGNKVAYEWWANDTNNIWGDTGLQFLIINGASVAVSGSEGR